MVICPSCGHPECPVNQRDNWTRYITMGIRDGELHHILARRGHTPNDIVNRTLAIARPHTFLTRSDRRAKEFDKLYVLTVGPSGNFGGSTNLKLQEIVEPPSHNWTLRNVRGLY